jgi:hypothetical protein
MLWPRGSPRSVLTPYATLVLLLVPVIILEPFKPAGAYLIAIGHLVSGVSLIAIGDLLKTFLVERLFHFSRDKLMTIPAFARVYNWAASHSNKGDGRPLGCLKIAVKIKLRRTAHGARSDHN